MSGKGYKTRTDLYAGRKAEQIPHISYDLDGDGVVGSRDYFIAKHFDKDNDDKLSRSEQRL